MVELTSCLAHIALAGATVLAWLGLGSLLLRRLAASGDRLLDGLNSIGVGAVAFALLTFGAGWAGVLHAAVFIPVFAVSALAGVATSFALWRGAALPRPRKWRSWQLALAALLAIYVVLTAVAACAPISSPDALLYHAANPALFEREHRIFEVPWNSSSYEPFTVEMLILDGFLVWDPVQGAFAPLLLALVALVAVMGITERLAGRSAALLAGAILFAHPFMAWEATSTYAEPGLACAVALAAWNILRFLGNGDRTALLLAGVFTGGAAGMKYLGLIAALALVVAAVLLAWRRLTLTRVLVFAVPAIAVASPWYVKNGVLTGNPFYPHLLGGLNSSAAAELEATMAGFGHGHSFLDFVLLPVRLLGDAEAFDGGEFLTPLFLAFAPLVLLLPPRRRPPLGVWAGVLLYVVAWFVTTQQARFLLPLMPALAALSALGVLALAARGRLGRAVAAGATSLALGTGLVVSLVYAAQFAPVALGVESRRDFLREKVSLYDGVEWLNQRLGPDDRVLTDNWTLLYLDVPYLTFGTMGDLLPPEAGRNETRSFIERNHVTHVAILAANAERRRQMEYIDSQLIARVPVRSVRSRTRGDVGPWKEMLVFAVGRER